MITGEIHRVFSSFKSIESLLLDTTFVPNGIRTGEPLRQISHETIPLPLIIVVYEQRDAFKFFFNKKPR